MTCTIRSIGPGCNASRTRINPKRRAFVLLTTTLLSPFLAVGCGTPPRSAAVEPSVAKAVALGKSYVPFLATTYSDAWLAAAEALEDGKTVAEAQEIHQSAWKEARAKAFGKHVRPAFDRILPEGIEPTDQASRARVAKHWRAFARGLRSGR